jgi:hypothetical protein
MESFPKPTPSVEFDTHQHHIFTAEDVVFVLESLEQEVDPNGTYGEYINRINDMLVRQDFKSNDVQKDADELNMFIQENPGLLLWSTNETDTIEEIIVTFTGEDTFMVHADTNRVYVNVNCLSESYRALVTSASSAV